MGRQRILAGVSSGVWDGETVDSGNARSATESRMERWRFWVRQGAVEKGMGWRRSFKGSAAKSGMGRRWFRVWQGAVADSGKGRKRSRA